MKSEKIPVTIPFIFTGSQSLSFNMPEISQKETGFKNPSINQNNIEALDRSHHKLISNYYI